MEQVLAAAPDAPIGDPGSVQRRDEFGGDPRVGFRVFLFGARLEPGVQGYGFRHAYTPGFRKSSTTGTATSGRWTGSFSDRVPAGCPPGVVLMASRSGDSSSMATSEASLSNCAYSTFPARSGKWTYSNGHANKCR